MQQYVLVDQYIFAQAQQYVLTDQCVIAEEQQYVIENRQQYALIALICHQVQYNSWLLVQYVLIKPIYF